MPALELQLVMRGASEPDYGSGFVLRRGVQNWLITCQHNMESGDPLELTGSLDCTEVRILRPFQRSIKLDGRSVVGARVDGVLADCVAIELFERDLPDDCAVPTIETRLPAANTAPVGLTLMINGIQHAHNATASRQLLVQGYADGEVGNLGLRQFRSAEFSFLDPVKPFMMMFHPGATHGISGGPVAELQPDGRQQLVAIYTHNAAHNIDLNVSGQIIKATAETGAAVPLDLLVRAIDSATPGVAQIVNLST